jgi:Rieske Fe-S protein
VSGSASSSIPQEKLERRGVMIALAMAAGLVVSYGTAALYGLRYLFGRQAPARKVNVLVAAVGDVPDGRSLLREDLSGRKFLLIRRGESIRAFSTTCTHLGCQVHWKPEKKTFFCPCHDGVFDADGNPVSGPPPSPLAQYDVEIRGSSIFVTMSEA